ncbi:haloacid dehalogenase-like hydrolase domain-containing 5 isoform X1 [Daphnia pulicaria]|uniref:haloacid dehalogenase-like hydrolase domain-containing 5 isoform X1 n=2 Tax=Daphnia pulicaria TaxID=35523 RepID=UPI001EEC30C5|nr:haloacid dehalogenase-like hydrolase domain-containing 5 isoform X1 [Daphnia pulicaria]
MAFYLHPIKSLCQPRTVCNIFAKCLASPIASQTKHRAICTTNPVLAEFGFMFDIDGVIVRGKEVLPAAVESFKKLVDSNGKFRVPVIFVTNAGNNLRCQKAQKLTDLLGVEISQEQVVMAHSPLKMFKQFHNKRVLVSGQGPIHEISKNLGFTNVCTVEDIRKAFPVLDVVDQKRRETMLRTIDEKFPRIEAIVLMQEPAEWDSALQLIIDVLMTNGKLLDPPAKLPYPHIPLLACNMDLQWMAEAWMPRFGHGAFLVCLEELYKKITGRDMIYTALIGKPSELTMHHADNMCQAHAQSLGNQGSVKRIYFVGDNLNTDIFGANLYHRYLTRQRSGRAVSGIAAAVTGRGNHNCELEIETEDVHASAEECHSILVQTGVYNASSDTFSNHSPRDFLPVEEGLREPAFCVPDVLRAVELVFQQEKFD